MINYDIRIFVQRAGKDTTVEENNADDTKLMHITLCKMRKPSPQLNYMKW